MIEAQSAETDQNPLLRAMGEVAEADRVTMERDEAGVTMTFWRGEIKCDRRIANDDPAMDGSWEVIALEAKEALSA